MDKTPKGKSLRFVRPTSNKEDNTVIPDIKSNDHLASTPVKESKKPRIWENDNCCQDGGDLDVTWDWNSPKNIKPKILRTKKKEIRKSPKVTLKKSSQIDHIKNFEKLRGELQLLRDEIARVDDCLPLSPVDEQTIKEESINDCSDINSFIEEQYFHIENQERESCMKNENYAVKNKTINDMFDDSCDEQLFLCTQALEEKLCEPLNVQIKEQNQLIRENNCNITQLNIGEYKNSDCGKVNGEKRTAIKINLEDKNPNSYDSLDERSVPFRSAEDSFDAVLKEFDDEDIDILTQSNNNKPVVPRKFPCNGNLNLSFKRTVSDANVQYVPRKTETKKDSKFTFHRTHSFESAATSCHDDLPTYLKDKIERKRKEALAKLKEKKEKEKSQQSHPVNDPYSNISPMKCSPEEIEQKRLQAKAIRDSKQREIIEKNRLEALKRLEINRLKRLGTVKKQLVKK